MLNNNYPSTITGALLAGTGHFTYICIRKESAGRNPPYTIIYHLFQLNTLLPIDSTSTPTLIQEE